MSDNLSKALQDVADAANRAWQEAWNSERHDFDTAAPPYATSEYVEHVREEVGDLTSTVAELQGTVGGHGVRQEKHSEQIKDLGKRVEHADTVAHDAKRAADHAVADAFTVAHDAKRTLTSRIDVLERRITFLAYVAFIALGMALVLAILAGAA